MCRNHRNLYVVREGHRGIVEVRKYPNMKLVRLQMPRDSAWNEHFRERH
ncbi:MAG: hypothetical protein PHN84_11210 [Desulfuromonadaceae bacterium]|nr:hypothetical protein [Desulfuromonadaceae bacterium]